MDLTYFLIKVLQFLAYYYCFTDDKHISVKIDPSGWAWLVTGRKLFVWRYMPAAGTKVCQQTNLVAGIYFPCFDFFTKSE